MPERTLLVRTLVQHDTGGPGGMKLPGDQYSRLASDAGYLMALGVVELVNPPTAEDKLAAYGAVVIPIGVTASAPPWPPTTKSLDEWAGPYT